MADPLIIKHAQDVLRVVHSFGTDSMPVVARSIDHSWSRCVNDYHLDPSRLYAPTVMDGNLVKDRQTQHADLIEIARAEMDSLYEQISGSGYALLLTDASGIILCEKVDPTIRQMLRSAGLMIGADWSEQREGTNGIGTCISEGRSITVHRADHFRARHIGLSCSGAPIRDSSGRVVAALDASSVDTRDTRASQMHTMALVNISASLIEKCLFLRHYQNNTILRFHHRPELVNLLHDGALALSEDGTVIASDATACKLLGLHDRTEIVGRRVFELFDMSVGAFESANPSMRGAIWKTRDTRHGRRYFASFTPPEQRDDSVPGAMPARATRTRIEISGVASTSALTLAQLAGEDPQMLRNAAIAKRIAQDTISVMLRGPTGSGKEVFAKALHLSSSRADKPFVAVNCAAIPENLIESELFGYRPGAFTGARREGMRGKIQHSDGGTLFLDEIGDMPVLLQTRLLRVLEEQEVVPLGGDHPIKVDLRVICASHRNLREMIARGEFREDLYYRLNGITLELPPLSQRKDKEQVLRDVIASQIRDAGPISIDAEAFAQMLDYPWPGNVRELRNVVRTALAICEDRTVRLYDLPAEVRGACSPASCDAARLLPMAVTPLTVEPPLVPVEAVAGTALAQAERAALLTVIERNRWNMSSTAIELGISRNTLYRKIKRHGIPLNEGR